MAATNLVDTWKDLNFVLSVSQILIILVVLFLYIIIYRMSVRKIRNYVSFSIIMSTVLFTFSRIVRSVDTSAYGLWNIYFESMAWVFMSSLVMANMPRKKTVYYSRYILVFTLLNTIFLITDIFVSDVGRKLISYTNIVIILSAITLSLKYAKIGRIFLSRIKYPIGIVLVSGIICVVFRGIAVSLNSGYSSLEEGSDGLSLFLFILTSLIDYTLFTLIFVITLVIFAKSLFPTYITDKGTIYLVNEKKPLKSFEMFSSITFFNFKGMCIVRTDPEKIKTMYMLDDIPVYWLSKVERVPDGRDSNILDPVNLRRIVDKINEFASEEKNPVILFEGVEYLINLNDFKIIMKVLSDVKDIVVSKDAIIILPFDLSILDEKNASMLEREVTILDA